MRNIPFYVTCDRCYQPVADEAAHGVGQCPFEPRRESALVKDDTIDFLAENAWREPRHFTSQKAYERALDESGLRLKPKKARGVGPVSPETLRWAVARLGGTVPVTTRVLDETFTVQLVETIES